ncbi:hypothetical protein, partial [Sansalvadorimonas verongulae]|uniref:hypothetical protein n=1 Tax=Sansalvadorimonas verongulae TaxID=2172824 RepID=UPI001E50B1FC
MQDTANQKERRRDLKRIAILAMNWPFVLGLNRMLFSLQRLTSVSYLSLILTVAPVIVVDAGTDKQVSSCTLVFPSGEGEVDIISTGRIRTSSPVVQSL